MKNKFPIANNSDDSLEILFEPEGIDFILLSGSKMVIEIQKQNQFELIEIVFKNGFIEVYPGAQYRILIDGIEVHEF